MDGKSIYFTKTFECKTDAEQRCAILWNDQLIAGGNDGILHIFNWDGKYNTVKAHTSTIAGITIWKNMLVTGSYDTHIHFWDSKHQKQKSIEHAHNRWVLDVEVWKDCLFSSGYEQTIKQWNENLECERVLPIEVIPYRLFSIKNLLVLGASGKKLRYLTSEQVLQSVAHMNNAFVVKEYKGRLLCCANRYQTYMDFAPDGTLVWTDPSNKFQFVHQKPIWGLILWDNTMFISSSEAKIAVHKPDGTLVDSWNAHTSWIRTLIQWKNRLVSISDDKSVTFWRGMFDVLKTNTAVNSTWNIIRILYIGVLKNEDNTECYVRLLPKELIKEIAQWLSCFDFAETAPAQ